MPELVFKGKEYVYNHHLTVPYRPLVPDKKKGIGPADLGGNLIIHGDNLHALKSILPRYAGKVDLVFIDPPYNTGNENWSYNDNVNSPIMREWLKSNPVNAEDMLRHDKWLCMMWPRLTLLRELLSERGSLWMTLDDNEVHRARAIIEEIFGEDNFIAAVAWEKGDSPRMDAERFSVRHDVLLCFAKNAEEMLFQRLGVESGEVPEHYDKVDETGRRYYLKPLRAMGGQGESRMARPNLHYSLVAPDGTAVWPKMKDGQDGTWRWSKEKTAREVKRIEWKQGSGGWTPYFRIYADSMKGIPPETIFYNSEVGSSRSAKAEIKAIFFGEEAFETPKPVALLERILEIGSTKDSIVLDSFAGSGTTAHAVLRTNANDGGERRFILVEGENYADRITAERVRRVIKGYAFSGTQREELLREKLTWTQLQKADALLAKVEAIRTKEGFVEEATQMNLGDAPSPRKRGDGDSTRRFDKIAVSVKDGELLVEGEKKTSERVAGLDGEFTFCILAEPLDPEGILSGKTLPDYESLGAWLYYAATGGTLDSAKIRASDYYLGPALDKHVWLIYKPDLAFLKSADAALTLTFARTLREKMPGKPHLVFAAAKFLSNRQLLEHGVEYAALPHSLYRGT